ncbi:MAG: TonB-dependent receptor [Acidobacteria bacterium]|nr:TonB-dependent receptor [Acidobacteriota bacterium]
MRGLRSICVAAAIVLLCAGYVYSQAVNATLLGTVTDASGAVVPNAKVTATEVNTGVSRNTQTNESGNYTFPDTPPGLYAVTVESTGFKKETRKDITVIVNSSTRVDVALTPGAVTETIEVTGAPPLLQTDRADTGAKIESILTAALPLTTNRNYQSLLNLVPGTTRATFQHSQFFNATSSLQTEVNGQMRQGNSYQIEGIDNNERTGLLQVLVPPVEAIQVVDVSTSNFEAELGRAAGANTNVMLKSGTNEFHGAGYEFLRNSAMNARNFFDPSVGHLAYNYFGGNIGGPIRKNKMFFFGDFLRTTDHEANTNLGTIPPSSWRTGNLSSAPTTVYDPATGNADGTGRTPFAGNIIPANRISPIATKLLNLLPAPNQASPEGAPSNNYFALLPFTKDTNSFDVKIDDNTSDNGRLSGRFSYARPAIYQAPIFGMAGGWAQGAFEGTGIQKTYSAGINYNRIFSPTLIAEFRVGATHYHNDALNSDYGTTASKDIGIPGVNIDQWTSGLASINLNGVFSNPMVGYSASIPWARAEALINVVSTWTKTLGNHTIKWGGDYRRLRDDLLQTQTVNPRGLFSFGTAQTTLNPGSGGATPAVGTANYFGSFLLDLPSSGGRDIAAYYPALRAHQFFAFVQDKWQVSSKLTLDAGVRWEFYPSATPRFPQGFSNYNPDNNTLELAGTGSVPMNLGIQSYYRYFAPRLGIAYRLNSDTVIRTGFGVSYTPFPDNTYAYNFPVKQNNQFSTGTSNYQPAVTPSGFFSMATGFPAPQLAVIPSSGIITNPSLTQSDFVIPKDWKNPYVESWNFSVQRSLPLHFTLDAAYVGNHGVRTVATYNLNVPVTADQMGKGAAGRPLNQRFGRTADTTVYFRGFSSMYNALQVKINRRFTNGLAITTSYTIGKGMSYQTGDDGNIWTYINPRRSYARTDFDRHQTFVQSYVYDLPFGVGRKWLHQGLVAHVLGGWQVNGILTLMTGTPLTFGANGNSLNTPGSPQTADQVAPVTILHGINTPSKGGSAWFSQSSFVQPTGVRFGSSGRNILSGPNFFNADASLFKIFNFTERIKAEIRGEAFSVTNTAQFNNPTTDVSNGNYGYITGAGGGRGMQLGFKLSF